MYYVLLDISGTEINIDSIDVKSLESPYIVTYWVNFTELTVRRRRLALLVINADTGYIEKNLLGPNKQVTAYELDLLSFMCLPGDTWEERPGLQLVKRRMVEIYGSKQLFMRKLELYKTNSLIAPITG